MLLAGLFLLNSYKPDHSNNSNHFSMKETKIILVVSFMSLE
jgi:hypothetical protein